MSRRYQNLDATANLVAQAAYGHDADGNLTSLVYSKAASQHAAKLRLDLRPAGQHGHADQQRRRHGDLHERLDRATSEPAGRPIESLLVRRQRQPQTVTTAAAWHLRDRPEQRAAFRRHVQLRLRCRGELHSADAHRRPAATRPCYTWDNRNRLTSVTFKDSSGNVTRRSRTPTTPSIAGSARRSRRGRDRPRRRGSSTTATRS